MLKPEGYKILVEVLARGQYQAVIEVPYIFIEQQQGRSKLGLRQYREFVTHLLYLSWETRELQRFVKNCLVGATGVLVNMGVLALLAEAGMAYLQAGALAVEASIGTNFLLNEFCPSQIARVDTAGSSPAYYGSSNSTSFVLEERASPCLLFGS